MNRLVIALLSGCIPATLMAQGPLVTATARTLTTASMTVTVQGSPPVTRTLPPGSPAPFFLHANVASATAIADGLFGTTLEAGPAFVTYGVHEDAVINSAGPLCSAATGPNETLLQLQLNAPVRGRLVITWRGEVVGNGPFAASVDVFNDGIVDFTAGIPGARLEIPIAQSGGTVVVRTITRAAAGGSAPFLKTQVSLLVDFVPDCPCTVLDIAPGCGPGLAAYPTFDGRLGLSVRHVGGLTLLVLGLRQTTVALPVLLCPLEPAPDVVVPVVAGPTRVSSMLIDVSPFAPIRFFAQGVEFLTGSNQAIPSNAVEVLWR
jgi:hypothetical protein